MVAHISLKPIEIERILPTTVTQRPDDRGGIEIVMQHEGMDEFVIANVHYDYRYTSNGHRSWLADEIVKLLNPTPKNWVDATKPQI